MSKAVIILVDDQAEVLASLAKDLSVFEKIFDIEECESVKDALSVIEDLDAKGRDIAAVFSDQIMPDRNGVELLAQLHADDRFRKISKVLVTGQASHDDTIDAINSAHVDYYVKKPWASDKLVNIMKRCASKYFIRSSGDLHQYPELLDQSIILEHFRENG